MAPQDWQLPISPMVEIAMNLLNLGQRYQRGRSSRGICIVTLALVNRAEVSDHFHWLVNILQTTS